MLEPRLIRLLLALLLIPSASAAALVTNSAAPSGAPVQASSPPAAVASAVRARAVRLTLAEAVALASAKAPAVALAALRVREAESRRDEARAALLPSLTGTAGITNRTFNKNTLGFSFPAIPGVEPSPDLVGPFDVADARLRASQTVLDPAAWGRWRAAGIGAEASRAERNASGEGAAQAAALAYVRALRARALLDARHADEALAADLLDLAQSQNSAGVAPGIDVTRARTQLATSRFAVVQARSQLERAEIDLARTLGTDPAQRFDLADSLSESLGLSVAPDSGNGASALAETKRPDLAAAQARVRRARAERTATNAERLPRVEASANWGASGPQLDRSIDTRELSVAVTLPLLDGLRRESRLSEQSATLEEERVRERDLRDQIAADIAAARIGLESARQQIGLAHESAALAAEELDQARERFANGVAGNSDVINAQSSLVHSREVEIDARYALVVARVELARAAGVVQTLR